MTAAPPPVAGDITAAIGNTPMVELPRLAPHAGVRLLAKLEGGNPTAYICQQMTCSAPITNPVALSQALQLPRRQLPQQQQQMGQPVGRA